MQYLLCVVQVALTAALKSLSQTHENAHRAQFAGRSRLPVGLAPAGLRYVCIYPHQSLRGSRSGFEVLCEFEKPDERGDALERDGLSGESWSARAERRYAAGLAWTAVVRRG